MVPTLYVGSLDESEKESSCRLDGCNDGRGCGPKADCGSKYVADLRWLTRPQMVEYMPQQYYKLGDRVFVGHGCGS